MNYSSTISTESLAMPGVTYAIRKMSEGIRIGLRRSLSDHFHELRAIEAEEQGFLANLGKKYEKPAGEILISELSPEERQDLDTYADRKDEIQDVRINPAYLKASFVSVEGLKIDGKTPDADLLLASGPPDLVKEILRSIFENSGLSGAQKENLELPTTSSAEAGGQTSGSNAGSAEEKNSISKGETAASITQI